MATVLDAVRSLVLAPSINVDELNKGDHIFVFSKLGFYSHHGIYIGNDRVIHYMGTKAIKPGDTSQPCAKCGYVRNKHRPVVKTCVDCFHNVGFLSGTKLFRYRYGVQKLECELRLKYLCTSRQSLPADEVVARANQVLESSDQFGGYDFFMHNCEDFATYCKCGVAFSSQAEYGVGIRKHILKPIQNFIHDLQS